MLHRGQCVSRVELLDAVWNMEPAQTTNIVDVYVNYLRRKLKDPPPGFLLRTVRGQGYLVPSETEMQLPVPLLIAQHSGELPSGQSGTQILPVAFLGSQEVGNQQALTVQANGGQLGPQSSPLHGEGSIPELGP